MNNVGVQLDDGTPTHMLDEAVWDKVLDINLKSYFLLSKHVLSHWMDNDIKGTAIVNVLVARLAVTTRYVNCV